MTCGPNDGMDGLKKRMLSPDGRNLRVLLIDNIKSLKFSWDELEGLITSDTISGRMMYVGEGRLPNVLTVCLTINGATLSKDMAQRLVPVELKRPQYSATWEDDTIALIDSRRWEIVGDILAILTTPKHALTKFSRWGAWERAVLSCVNDPEGCQRLIEQRQAAVDDDQDEHDLVRQAFMEDIRFRGFDPEEIVVLIPSQTAAMILEKATGERRPVNKASAMLKTLGIKELRKSDRKGARIWEWRGRKAPFDAVPAIELDPPR